MKKKGLILALIAIVVIAILIIGGVYLRVKAKRSHEGVIKIGRVE
ncbi:MAG TPA: hypothetical protein VFF27_00650 [Bacteroidia bacterium]|jgi:hypothetical protein|nr:hypothetical protein [Bacteroidia bacterium]